MTYCLIHGPDCEGSAEPREVFDHRVPHVLLGTVPLCDGHNRLRSLLGNALFDLRQGTRVEVIARANGRAA